MPTQPTTASGQLNATSGTPHQDDRPMKGAKWLAVNGRTLPDDECVIVGAEAYKAGERITHGRNASIPDIPPVGGNIFTGSASITISVENMPPVLAARILNLLDASVGILRAGQDPAILAEGWKHIDNKDKLAGADHFQATMNWCADAEFAINPRLQKWTDDWMRINFTPPLQEGDTVSLTIEQTRRLIAVAYALGKHESAPKPNPENKS